MKKIFLICKHESTLLIRNGLFKLGFLLIFLLGVYAIFYGKSEIDHQKATLVDIQKNIVQKMAELRASFKTDTLSYIIGNHTFKLVENPPGPWANLSIGQRDIYPFYVYLRYWSLSRQVLTTEINNPEKLLVGNFDLAFVLIYIFPLFIIAISYNLLSSERESGTIYLLLSNQISIHQILYIKLFFRFVLIFLLTLMLIFLAIIICSIKIDKILILWIATTALYFGFWFGIILIINKLNKNSAFNALSLVSSWITFILIIPTVINLFLANFFSPSPRYDLSHAIRHDYEGIWTNFDKRYHVAQTRNQMHRQPAMDTIKSHDVKYLSVLFDSYDEKLEPLFRKYEKLSLLKEQVGQNLSLLSPAALSQQIFNCLAKTDSRSYYDFLEEVRKYHAQLKSFFYEKIFNDQAFTQADFAKIPSYHYQAKDSSKHALKTIFFLFLGSCLVWSIGLKMKLSNVL